MCQRDAMGMQNLPRDKIQKKSNEFLNVPK